MATLTYKNLAVIGCQSGSIQMINLQTRKIELIREAHDNLIRCIVSLENQYAGQYFVTADVSGFLKVWQADFKKPVLIQTIQL
jgi:hypothetical protein